MGHQVTLTITGDELHRAKELHANGDTTGVWNYLASLGDKYAASAASVTSDPLSRYGQIVRHSWHETSADFSKFDNVAHDYQGRYLDTILDSSNGDGTYRLPKTTGIETNYIGALKANEVSPYAAIDADLALANVLAEKHLGIQGITWPQILGLEPERIGPTSDEVLKLRADRGAEYFKRVFLDTMASEAATQFLSARAATIDSTHALNEWLGRTQEPDFESIGGINFLSSPNSPAVAIFDKNMKGQAYFDHDWHNIGPDNWRYDPPLNQYEYKSNNGSWNGTNFADPGVNAFISAANAFGSIDGLPANLGPSGQSIDYFAVPAGSADQRAIPLADIFTQQMRPPAAPSPTP